MKILFFYSRQDSQSVSKPLYDGAQIQFGISYISALLRQHGHLTDLLVCDRATPREVIDKTLHDLSPQLICFSTVYTEYDFIADIAAYIKKRYPHIFLLVGGAHPSLNPEDCLKDSFDGLCVGEGEYPVLELVEQLVSGSRPSGIRNLWIKNNKRVEKNSTRPFLNNLDKLPFPDREMWRRWISNPDESCSVLLGRGCPFQCSYCCNHALKKLAQGAYVRFRSPDNIVDEIKEIVMQNPAIKDFFLEVETIAFKESFVTELCLKLKIFNDTLTNSLSFATNMRVVPNVNFEPIFDSFRKSNFKYIIIGLESGSERVRSQILKRNYSNQDIIDVVTLARKYGLKVYFQNMVGIPGEEVSDFEETIKINRKCLPDRYFISIFFPYPGTNLYSLAKARGLIDGSVSVDMERCKAVLDLPGFSKKQIQKSYAWFDYHVYKGYKPLYKILARVLVSRMKENYYLNKLYRDLTNYRFFRWVKNTLRRC